MATRTPKDTRGREQGKPDRVDVPLIGQRIVDIRQATPAEAERQGWHCARFMHPVVLVLESGTTLFPSADYEGNGPGALFGHHPLKGQDFIILPPECF